MNQESEDIRLAAAVLTAHLREVLDRKPVPENSEPISDEDLFEWVAGGLDATEREELIEQLALNPADRERLADLLVGYGHWEAERTTESAPAAVPAALAALRDWVRQTMDFLSPVLAYSSGSETSVDLVEYAKENNLLATIDFDSLDQSFEPRAMEIRDLVESGHLSAHLLNIQAAVMEVHLVLSRDRRGDPAGFFTVWEPVSSDLDPGSKKDWNDAYRSVREVYGRAIGMDPNLAEAYVGRARIELQLGDLERAEENLEKAASLDPSEASAYHLLAQIRNRRKN